MVKAASGFMVLINNLIFIAFGLQYEKAEVILIKNGLFNNSSRPHNNGHS